MAKGKGLIKKLSRELNKVLNVDFDPIHLHFSDFACGFSYSVRRPLYPEVGAHT